jgi:hypothetical protein
MDSQEYWQLFMETGAPEIYMMYTKALKSEGTYVPEHHGPGAEGQRLQ